MVMMLLTYNDSEHNGYNFTSTEMKARHIVRKCMDEVPAQQKFTEAVAMVNEIISKGLNILIEIGRADGGTLKMLIDAAPDNATIISIDVRDYSEDEINIFNSWCRDGQSLHLIHGSSVDVTKKVKKILDGRMADFLFIDGDHSYKSTMDDYNLYSPMIRKGGIIAMHDLYFLPGHPGQDTKYVWNDVKGDNIAYVVVEDPDVYEAGIGIMYKDTPNMSYGDHNVRGRISVIIPVYNGERYIEKPIQSLINQTYDDIEIIVVDDGCTDRSIEIATSLLEDSGRRYAIYHTDGPSAWLPRTIVWPFLVGVLNSTGEYCTVLPCDDYCHEDRFSILINNIGNDAAIFSSAVTVDDDGNILNEMYNCPLNNGMMYQSLFNYEGYQSILMGTAIFRKDIYLHEKVYLYSNPLTGDLAFTYAMYGYGNIRMCPDSIMYYTIRGDGSQCSHTIFDDNRYMEHGYSSSQIYGNSTLNAFGNSLDKLFLDTRIKRVIMGG